MEKTFIQRNGQNGGVGILGGVDCGVSMVCRLERTLPLQVIQQMLDFMKNGVWGVLIYIVLYAVRPLILFPSTILTLAGGFVFGPVLGVLYTIIASNISSTIAFYAGRFFR